MWTGKGIGTLFPGVEVPASPFRKLRGSPPPGWKIASSSRGRGGNMDNKEFVSGRHGLSSGVCPGGLFSVGDGHGCQGDGESVRHRNRDGDDGDF